MSIAELKQALAQQQATPLRRFERAEDVLTFTTNEKPDKTVKVTLDMCVFSVEEKPKFWSIMLVPKSRDNFQERKKLINNLDDEQKSKYLFCLALWKAKRPSSHDVCGEDYLPGKDYVFSNVNDIHVYYGVVQGSVHVRHVVKQESDDPRFVKPISVTSRSKSSTRDVEVLVKKAAKTKASLDTKKDSTKKMTAKASVDGVEASAKKTKAKSSVDCNERSPKKARTKASVDCNELSPKKAKTKASVDYNGLSPKKAKTKASVDCNELSPKKAKTKASAVGKELAPRKAKAKAGVDFNEVSPKKAKAMATKARPRKTETSSVVMKRVSRAKTTVSKTKPTIPNPDTSTSKAKDKAEVARIVILDGDDDEQAMTEGPVDIAFERTEVK